MWCKLYMVLATKFCEYLDWIYERLVISKKNSDDKVINVINWKDLFDLFDTNREKEVLENLTITTGGDETVTNMCENLNIWDVFWQRTTNVVAKTEV